MRLLPAVSALLLLGCSARSQTPEPVEPVRAGRIALDGRAPGVPGYILLSSSTSDLPAARVGVDSAGHFSLPALRPGYYGAEIYLMGYNPGRCLMRLPDDLSQLINIHVTPTRFEAPLEENSTSVVRCVSARGRPD